MTGDLRDTGKCIIVEAVQQKQSDKAWLLYFPDIDDTLWIPKSQCQWEGPDEWLLTEWIAKQKGLL